MVLDATARLTNIKDSIKKYFVDSLETTEGIALSFDKALVEPATTQRTTNRWVTVDLGQRTLDDMSEIVVNIYCCTRKDNEGYRLAQLVDTVMGYLTVDPTGTSGDSTKRIAFYRSKVSGAWDNIGGLVVTDLFESSDLEAPDETKYRVITVRLKTASKV